MFIHENRERYDAELRENQLFIQNNCYFAETHRGPIKLSNFIMEPVCHMRDGRGCIRIFRLINSRNQKRMLRLTEQDLTSISRFSLKVESLGNFIWLASIQWLNNLKAAIYCVDTAQRITNVGPNATYNFTASRRGVERDGVFYKADDCGLVRIDDETYYLDFKA